MLSEMIIPLTSSSSPPAVLRSSCSPASLFSFVGESVAQENVETEPIAAVYCRSGDYFRILYMGSGERKDCEIRTMKPEL